MHSFKKFSKAVLVIAVCTAILILLDTALYPCTFMRNDVHTVVTQQFDDIILGTSHGKMDIDPESMEEVNGRTGHNLCVGGEYGIDAYYLTKLISEKQKPKRIFVVHGQDQVTDNFAAHLKEVVGVDAVAPYSGDIYDLQQNLCVVQGSRKLAEKRRTKKSGNTVFERLLAAGQRLIAVIHKNKEVANNDMAKFADQINALCDKWDR